MTENPIITGYSLDNETMYGYEGVKSFAIAIIKENDGILDD